MDHPDHSEPSERRSFLRTPVGLVVVGFLAVGAFLLISEHRAHIFTGSWFLWLLPLMCLGMHFFHGHGGHGGSDEHDHRSRPQGQKGDKQ